MSSSLPPAALAFDAVASACDSRSGAWPSVPSKSARCTGLCQRIRPYAMLSKLAVVLDEAKHFWRNGDLPD